MADSAARLSIAALNDAPAPAFIAALGAIYEHSPWVAERSVALRPFADMNALAAAMAGTVAAASDAEKSALITAHPDLAGRLARAGKLAPSSAGEQAGLGLDRLSDEEFENFESLNAAYRKRFGFPFIIAVRRHTRASVLQAFHARLGNDEATERATALREIDLIARLRLDALLAG
jgi:2-oxo-4-hydroxy-4-carboxy-5-ureidoimidazoline decarboxylase